MEKQKQQNDDNFIMLPTVDVCFVGLMDDERVRNSVCAAALGVRSETIGKTELKKRDLPRNYADDKLGILDARVFLKDGTQMNLEMQVDMFPFWNNRSLFYLCKMFAEQLKKGDDYGKLKKCIHISILDFTWLVDDDSFWHRIRVIDEITGKCYNELFELQLWELPKLAAAMKKLQTDSPDELLSAMQGLDGKSGLDYANHKDIITWMQFFNGKKREDFAEMAEKK